MDTENRMVAKGEGLGEAQSGRLGLTDEDYYIHKKKKKKGPTVQQGELYSTIMEKNIFKKACIYN